MKYDLKFSSDHFTYLAYFILKYTIFSLLSLYEQNPKLTKAVSSYTVYEPDRDEKMRIGTQQGEEKNLNSLASVNTSSKGLDLSNKANSVDPDQKARRSILIRVSIVSQQFYTANPAKFKKLKTM